MAPGRQGVQRMTIGTLIAILFFGAVMTIVGAVTAIEHSQPKKRRKK